MSLDPAIVRFFEKKGYTREQAKGIAAGIYAETANNHTAFNSAGGGQGAFGLGQWRGPRLRALREQYGKNPSKTQQLEFLHTELQGGDPGGPLVTAQKNARSTFEAYIHKFMRPGSGAAGDLQRGYKALGVKGGDRASAGGGSTFDQVQARRRAQQGLSMQSVFQAYRNTGKAGGMTPQDAAQFERAVLDGHVMLPRGTALRVKPAAPVLPKSVVEAYNSHRMDDDPEARAEIDRAVAAGEVSLPRGLQLKAPAPRGAGELLGMGTRSLLEGAGGLLDIVGAPVNTTINAVAGTKLSTTPFKDLGAGAADRLGFAKPESASELTDAAIQQGGTQGLLTAGAGFAAAGAKGAAGAAGRMLSGSPVLDTVSGAVAGGAQETARQAGAGPVGQIAAGLLGGAAPVGLAAAASRIRPRGLPDAVAETPRAAVIDEAGDLTPDGVELAARHDVSPEQLRQAYDTPPEVQRGTANDDAIAPTAREATTDQPVADEPPAPQQPRDADMPPQPNPPGTPDQQDFSPLPTTALARVTDAAEFGVDMTRGQATKSFDIQDAETQLRNRNGPEGEAMRQFVAKQADQVKVASTQFREAFGDTDLSPESRGAIVQEAVRDLRDAGQAGVSALYRQARELGEPLDLDTSGVKAAYDRVMVEANVPDAAKAEITQEAARYGLIGKVEGTNEAGITTVKLDDGTNVRFYGQPEPLRLDNAEQFRKVVSDLYQSDGKRKLTQTLKRAIDDAVEEAAVKVADGTGGNMSEAMATARKAHVQQKQTFEGGDIVQKIADWKKGQDDVTGALSPEQVMGQALAKTSDLRRVKAVLLSKPTEKSRAAWRAIQAHGLATVFEKATQRNANIGGEITDAISGAKLRTSIEGFGVDKLKVLLDGDEFNQLMKLRRVIEDVTIPISGTVNHSNSGNLIMRLMSDVDNRVTAAFGAAGAVVGGPAGAAVGGTIGRTISPAIKAVKETKAAAETLKGATQYTPDAAAVEAGPKPSTASRAASKAHEAGARTIQGFIETYSSPRIIAPLLVSTNGVEE
ncbi:hypothetical protein HNO88_000311 [Novosphingobium chloroacetimidivorans]|uniref:Phage tail lysozyme domain-containing protein n=1 Tax=Novosphingobium chloroacetimidivorans TaxID=1428314 RepID=A0A7W7NV81_9SPHN|nr:phage tail tip lysozyme [Novosphingobium chloroacetimidivorans]MBB4857014.1 hypothetical protein [Novosphingobium chloroacetimidivorans]